MVYYVMNTNGKVIARSTVTPVDKADHDITSVKQRMVDLDHTIVKALGDYKNAVHERKKDLLNIDGADIVRQIGYCFDLDSDEIDKSDEDVKQDSKGLNMMMPLIWMTKVKCLTNFLGCM